VEGVVQLLQWRLDGAITSAVPVVVDTVHLAPCRVKGSVHWEAALEKSTTKVESQACGGGQGSGCKRNEIHAI
jgi:hypothetical protein